MWQEPIKRVSVTFQNAGRDVAGAHQESFGELWNAGKDASGAHEDNLGELRSVGRSVAGAYQESLGDLQNAGKDAAGAHQESLGEPWNAGNDASGAHEDSLGEPRSVGRSVAGACQESLGDHENAATAEALRPARAAAGRSLQRPSSSRLRVLQQLHFGVLFVGQQKALKSRSLTLVPSSWLTWAGKPKQTDAEGVAQKLMQLAMSDTRGSVNLGTALTSRFQILARFRHQNLEPRKRLHDYFPNLNTKPGPQF